VTRSRATAKAAGTRFERLIADYLAARVDDRVDRRPKTGSKDKGDIGGVRTAHGHRVVIECKDSGGSIKAGEWMNEADVERGNDDALVGMVIAKRKGTQLPGEQWVLMTVEDLIALLTGERAW
jgi:hypothetical protein